METRAVRKFPYAGGEIVVEMRLNGELAYSGRDQGFDGLVLQAQKMSTLGQMTVGIAHDFNNLLTVVLGNAALIGAKGTDPCVAEAIQAIDAAVSRGSAMCRQIMSYASRGDLPMEPVDLSAMVGSTADLVRVAVPGQIRVFRAFSPGLPSVMIDRSQVGQVILNLILNASEAIGNGEGIIRIGTRLSELAEPLPGCRISGSVQPGRWVEFFVEDTGCGMSDETLERIFEPFYTTKTCGHGLGMSAVLAIIQRHGGHIMVCSKPGQGTVFRIFLPCAGAAKAPSGCKEAAIMPISLPSRRAHARVRRVNQSCQAPPFHI